MLTNFIVYPEATEKLEKSGLKERVEEAAKKYKTIFYGHVYDDEVVRIRKDMEEEGYFSEMPSYIKGPFMKVLNDLFNKSPDVYWTIQRPDKKINVEPGNGEILIFLGYYASLVLKPNEFWQYEKFGFDSFSEFHGTITQHMNSIKIYMGDHDGYIWESEADGRAFQTSISGSVHGDLRIYRIDITHDPTLDVFGNTVHYRPICSKDRFTVAGADSTECQLLADVLKYIEQEEIESEILKDSAREFIAEVEQWPEAQREPVAGRFGKQILFSHFEFDMPRFGDEKHNLYSVGTKSTPGGYGLYVDENKNLLFVGLNERYEPDEKPSLVITPNEADHMIRGLFVQAKNMCGRTLPKALLDTLNYYFSDKFKEEREEQRKKNSK